MEIIKSIIIAIISPLTPVFLLLGACLLFNASNSKSRVKHSLTLIICILFIFSQPYTSALLLYPLEHFEKAPENALLNDADYIYTPACNYRTAEDISYISRWPECSLKRLYEAAQLSKVYGKPIIVTGGYFLKDPELPYAEQAKIFLTRIGIDENRIITINEGTTTYTEIRAIADVVKNKKIVAVSSATHIRRVAFTLTHFEALPIVHPTDYRTSGELEPYLSWPSGYALERSKLAFYEYLAIIKYEIFY